MQAVILNSEGIILNFIEVEDEKTLDLIMVGDHPKLMRSDIVADDEPLEIGQDVSAQLKARQDAGGLDAGPFERIARFFGFWKD